MAQAMLTLDRPCFWCWVRHGQWLALLLAFHLSFGVDEGFVASLDEGCIECMYIIMWCGERERERERERTSYNVKY